MLLQASVCSFSAATISTVFTFQLSLSIGSACGKSYKTMAVLNNAVRYAMDGFIGILDMFGFEDGRVRLRTHLGNGLK